MVIGGKLSIYCLYTMENISIYCNIINKTRKKYFLIIYALTILIVPVEIKNKFTPDPPIKLIVGSLFFHIMVPSGVRS